MAFVAIGFDHVVASMVFLPAAIFASAAYWFLYLRGTPDDVGPTGAEPETAQAGNGHAPARMEPVTTR